MLALDLGVFHRKAHEVALQEALRLERGLDRARARLQRLRRATGSARSAALEFLTGYLIEKALSVDNIFVFVVDLRRTSRCPPRYQHRVLFWGILGALVMRAVFIVAGAALLARFHWVIYVFGAFLVFTGVKLLLRARGGARTRSGTRSYRLFRRAGARRRRATTARASSSCEDGRRYATPLLLVLVLVEVTDVVFAVDSIPAIFAVTSDPFIVFTSNIFAILGLRSLFFLLAGRDRPVPPAQARRWPRCSLFVGREDAAARRRRRSRSALSLGVVAGLIGLGVLASLLLPVRPVPSIEK